MSLVLSWSEGAQRLRRAPKMTFSETFILFERFNMHPSPSQSRVRGGKVIGWLVFGEYGNHGITNLEFHWLWPAPKSVLRSRPYSKNGLSNQVGQIALCGEEELSAAKNHILVIYVSLENPPFLLLFSLLRHLEKLDFSSVSTEAGHEPKFDSLPRGK